MAEGSATHLFREAKELVSLVHPGNIALVAASVIALAKKAASMGDRRTQQRIESLLRSVVSGSGEAV